MGDPVSITGDLSWVDQHCHLPDGPDTAVLVEEAAAAGVNWLVTVGTSVETSIEARAVAARFPRVVATAGVHPHDAEGGLDGLVELAEDPAIVAIGECGLDYHYNHSPVDAQRAAFVEQIHLAHRLDKPLVIHTRSAWDDTWAILRSEGAPARVVFHCFTGGPREAELGLEIGAHLSFSGIVTFPSAPELREAARMCPVDRLLVETDSPYLAPVPHRGRANRPALVAVVGAAVAAARNEPVEAVAAASTANAIAFYSLDSTPEPR